MRFGSFASGIEAASVAWKPLGMRPAFFSEVDKFCCSLLAQRHDDTPNLGDMNEITTHALRRCGKLDIVIAGTPCQAFSVAGNRGGITDPRGQLALRLLDMVEYTRPRWVVWENVPGVLSSWTGPTPPSDLAAGQEWEAEETSDFGCFLEALSHLGYGWAYRVYDAQFSGVPQRRRRVFLVGYLGDWTRAARVLFEPHCVSGDFTQGGEPGKDITGTLTARTRGGGGLGTDFECDGGLVAHTLRGEGFDASEDGTGRGTPLVPIAYRTTGNCGAWNMGDKIDTLTTGTDPSSHILAFSENQRGEVRTSEMHPALATGGGKPGQGYPAVLVRRAVRRLTPRECERLMGLPDDYTLITYRKKPACDGPRYKAIGNSIAIPDLRWIGEQIKLIDG